MKSDKKFRILIVDDEVEYQESFTMLLAGRGYHIETANSGEDALEKLKLQSFHLVLTDLIMGGMDGVELLETIRKLYMDVEVIMITGYGSIENAVTAIKKGAFSYFIKSSNPEMLLSEIDKMEKLFNVNKNMLSPPANPYSAQFMMKSTNIEVHKIIDIIDKVAGSNASIIITGESGTGKEVFAKYIHELSNRSQKKFVAVNCQALSENLLESELFGHEKGSFTGASERRIGRFEEASGGTLFLDEIGEMPVGIQVKLLRVLETKIIERIGSNTPLPIDLRLVSATNKNIKEAIKNGTFREDLFYRINTIILEIPPLRKRKDELPVLIDFFINKYKTEYNKPVYEIEKEVSRFLSSYHYPGNIRELKNIIERLVVLSDDGILRCGDLPNFSDNVETQPDTLNEIKPLRELKKEVEKKYISSVLLKYNGNVTEAAKHLCISRRQLFNKVVEYNLKY